MVTAPPKPTPTPHPPGGLRLYASNPFAADREANWMAKRGHHPLVFFGRAVSAFQFCYIECQGCDKCYSAKPKRITRWLDRVLWRIYVGKGWV